jgi:cyclopropane fatty-acyl-phospholipid synthase-like methyltransferase
MEAAHPAPADVKDRLKASYDAMAPQYNAWTVRHHSLRHKYLDKLCELCPQLTSGQNAHVLELGCGAGVPVLSTLLEKNDELKVTALDLSDTQIGLAKENLKEFEPRATFIAGDMVKETADTPPSSCTAVIALYSLIHLSQEEQVEMIQRIAGWLEKDGCFLAVFGKDEAKGMVMEKWLHEKGWVYFSGLGVEGTVKIVEEAGLKVEVKVVEEGPEETFLWVIARK